MALRTVLIISLLVSSVSAWPVGIALADPSESESKAITHLVGLVKESPLKFIRNGGEHTGREAADHIMAKYARFRKDIGSAEQFIDRCASASMLSGKPYLVRLPNGEEKPVKEWLRAELQTYRAGAGASGK